MPSYNPGEGLAVTLDSLRRQGVPFRLFVVDDGSPQKPDYRPLLRDFDHELIELPRNVGVNLVRNAGLERILAEGFPLVALIDCGDAMAPDRLKLQAGYLQSHPETDIVGAWIEMHYSETGRSFEIHWPIDDAAIRRDLWTNMSITHPVLMIRAEVFRKVGLYTAQYEAAEDYDFCRRAMKAGFRFHNIDRLLLYKYETRDSISWRKRRAQLKSRWRIQWAYRDLTNPHCLKGLIKTGLILAVPDGLAPRIKALLGRG
jgi:GT2 family glycosyltransferase